jgi:hypothetical protein
MLVNEALGSGSDSRNQRIFEGLVESAICTCLCTYRIVFIPSLLQRFHLRNSIQTRSRSQIPHPPQRYLGPELIVLSRSPNTRLGKSPCLSPCLLLFENISLSLLGTYPNESILPRSRNFSPFHLYYRLFVSNE